MWVKSPERRAAYGKSGTPGVSDQGELSVERGKNLAASAVDGDNYLRKYQLL
jgi:hypothetical protein